MTIVSLSFDNSETALVVELTPKKLMFQISMSERDIEYFELSEEDMTLYFENPSDDLIYQQLKNILHMFQPGSAARLKLNDIVTVIEFGFEMTQQEFENTIRDTFFALLKSP